MQEETINYFHIGFPHGHRDSIKPLFADLCEQLQAGAVLEEPYDLMNRIHPRALKLILQYGQDYMPHCTIHRAFAAQARQPAARNCFLNTYELMRSIRQHKPTARVAYVEGVACDRCMLHSWNGIDFSRRAVDWTCYAISRWTRYLGIPFTLEEYHELMRLGNPAQPCTISLLFRYDNFPRYEEHLLCLLAQSRTRHPPVSATSVS